MTTRFGLHTGQFGLDYVIAEIHMRGMGGLPCLLREPLETSVLLDLVARALP
jgi:hypothetical protein